MPKQPVVSNPTMCLHCHMIVLMIKSDWAWTCQKCQHQYPFKFWKIKEAKQKPEVKK